MRTNLTASATVAVTLEIPSGSTWGGDCDINQIEKQASEAVLNRLQNDIGRTNYKLIGKPKVTTVLVVRES